MAGKRLLDVAALLNASRGVAQNHVALRSRHLEIWGQTSSLAKAVKSQTDRVTETAKAASLLASRLNESKPPWTAEATQFTDKKTVPSCESTEATGISPAPKEALEQDHIYESSESNTSSDPVPTEGLEIHQTKSDPYPLPNGTIPLANSSVNVPERDQDVFSEQTPSPPKYPLKEKQEEDGAPRPVSLRTPTIPNPSKYAKFLSSEPAQTLQRQFEQQIPSQPAGAGEEHSDNKLFRGHDGDIFYTPSKHSPPVLSSLPRIKVPKQIEDAQGNDALAQYDGINSDTYSSASAGENPIPGAQAVQEQEEEEVPEGVNTDLFYSPRVAEMLGGQTQAASKGDLRMKAAEKTRPGYTSEPSSMRPEGSQPPDSINDTISISSKDNDVTQLTTNITKDVLKAPNVSAR